MMKRVRQIMAMFVVMIMLCTGIPMSVSADTGNGAETVELGNTDKIKTVDALRTKLATVADITEDGNTITIKMNKNINGRICLAIPGKYIIFDANNKVLSSEGYDEALCLDHIFSGEPCTVELIGNGTYNNGRNYAIYVGNSENLIVKSATVNGSISDYSYDSVVKASLESGYDYYKLLINGETVTNPDNGSKKHESDYSIETVNTSLVVTQYNNCAQHTYSEVISAETIKSEATCTSPAVYYKTCSVCEYISDTETFTSGENATHVAGTTWVKDENYHWKTCSTVNCGVKIESTNAAHVYGDDNICDVCEYEKTVDSTRPIIPCYVMLESMEQPWTQNGSTKALFRANGDFAKFTGVKVDGVVVDASNYTAESGSTIVILKDEYLGTLSDGTHELIITFTDGDCSTVFKVQKNTTDNTITNNTSSVYYYLGNTTSTNNTVSPKTGDSNPAFVLAIVAIGVATLVVGKRAKRV